MDLTPYWRRSKQPDLTLSLTWFRRFHKRLLNPILDEIASDRNLIGKRLLINPSKSSILHRALWAKQPNPTLKSTAYIVCHPEKAFRQLCKELCVFLMRNMSNLQKDDSLLEKAIARVLITLLGQSGAIGLVLSTVCLPFSFLPLATESFTAEAMYFQTSLFNLAVNLASLLEKNWPVRVGAGPIKHTRWMGPFDLWTGKFSKWILCC